ncbi:MAG: aldehyde ferredoxin oxidoreductase [bacterium]|nr:aldehyde ferredoxin oxidoreductase [bacterium]
MADRIIQVNMTDQSVSFEDLPEEWNLLGGRGLSAKILQRDCDPTCDPLGPENVLVLASGLLSGTAAPTSGRLSVGGKSPLTGGIKEASSGGNPSQDLNKLGFRAIIVKGSPSNSDARYGLEVDESGARVVAADHLKGLWNYATCEALAKNYEKTASFITIGPAGEAQLTGASVACTDQDGRRPSRHAGRGGLGAVMGSKGLKFVAVDRGKAKLRTPARKAEFAELSKKVSKAYLEGPQMFKTGTASVVPVANMLNTFPYKNRTEGQSPDVANLEGARINESFEKRGGSMHNCMTGCIVQCSNIVHDSEGNYKTSALEFETLTLLGANCAVASWEDVADLDRICDEVGLDTIEAGAALGVLMDAGKMEWGDAQGMKDLLSKVGKGDELADTVGNGAVAVGKRTGHHRIPVVKGQAIPAWDPRPLKATGVTYASGPMGADHTAGLIVNPGLPPEEFARASQEVQLINAVCDSSGFCQFLSPTLDQIREYYGHMVGKEVSREEIADQGWQILQDEWDFNQRAGLTEADDVLPQCMKEDAIGPANAVFDVSADVIADAKVRKPIREELFATKASG